MQIEIRATDRLRGTKALDLGPVLTSLGAAARDGSAFDLREFHDQVLGHGSLPLATLERELPTWVATPA